MSKMENRKAENCAFPSWSLGMSKMENRKAENREIFLSVKNRGAGKLF
jgi:hypothetical protein